MEESSRGHRLFRALLRLFPAEFRGDFGDQMSADFHDQRRATDGRPRELRRLWTRTTFDVVARALYEHLDVLRRDAVYALRTLRRHPVSTATAVLSLAIGIGLNSAVFSVVNGVLWRDLPFPDSDRLVQIGTVTPDDPMLSPFPAAWYADVQQGARQIEGIAGAEFETITILEPGDPRQLACQAVTPNFFDLLGTRPLLGRRFTSEEHARSRADRARASGRPSPRVMILSHTLWQEQFFSDRAVPGRRLRLAGGDRVEIVGVMGPDIASLDPLTRASCWTPGEPDPALRFGGSLLAIARLAPDASLQEAQAELDVLGANLPRRATEPRTFARPTSPGASLRAVMLHDRIVGDVRAQLVLLLGAVICVLLVTCANIANIFLARAAGRREELATRVALGATRARLTREMLTEALAVAIAGGMSGFLVAVWAVPALIAAAPPAVPRLREIGIDWSTFAFTALVTALVGTGCGLLASMAVHRRRGPALVPGASRATPRASRLRQGLAVAEIALALMLVIGATLMVRTVRALGAVELGFDPSRVISVELPSAADPLDLAGRQQLHAAIAERVKAQPGVRAAGVGLGPMLGGMFYGGLTIPGDPRDLGSARVDAVSPGYFEALGVRLVAGRFFEERDTAPDATPMIVVNERAARSYWNGADPIGRTLLMGKDPLQVVGVIADLREAGLEAEPGPTVYQLSTQSRNFVAGSMLIKVDGDPEALVPAIRSIVRSVNPEAPFRGVAPLQARIDRQTAPRRFVLQAIGLFSIIALVLAVVGVYGVIAEFVGHRVPEIGVRMTFGASTGDVARLILRQGWNLARVGVPLGLIGAVLLRGTMSTMVYGVETLDPLTYVAAALALLGATAIACAVPARRASRLDPVIALRAE
jgi:putative ABC transport system permease protein